MKIRYRVAVEIVIEGKDLQDIEQKFGGMDFLTEGEFIETECRNYINEDGTVGKEI